MSNWRLIPIGDLGKVTTGRTPPSSRPECFGKMMPFITPSDMTGSRTVEKPQRFLSEEGAGLLHKCVVEQGVAVSCIGWQMGKALLIEKPSVTNQQINTVVPNSGKVELLYLYYVLSARRDEIFRLGSGGSRTPILNKSAFSQLEIALPPLEEQHRIARILGALDDKIELDRRMNRTLETIARAIFKSWFIDFDPVIDNAILNGKSIPDEFAARAAVRREILARSQPSPPTPLPEVEGRDYRGGFRFSGLVEKARELRQRQTPAEEILWELLRDRRFLNQKFRRQHQIGDYISDFYCHDHKLVIELDGGIHRTQEAKDVKRNAYMESLGLTVIRIPNAQILESPEAVLSQIAQVAGSSSSPSGRGTGEGVAEYRHLFPDSFQDSPLGKIPKGWEASTVGETFDVTMGQSPPGSTYNEDGDGLPFFQGRRDFGFRYPTKRVFCTAPKRIAETGDTLVSVRAPVGDVNMAADRICVGRGLAGVRHRSGSRSYTYYSMRSLQSRFREYESEGTVFGAINKAQFSDLEWVSPPNETVEAFENRLFAVDERIGVNEEEATQLAVLRDSLLPKLMSGHVFAEEVEPNQEVS